jgi:hypothetical protein
VISFPGSVSIPYPSTACAPRSRANSTAAEIIYLGISVPGSGPGPGTGRVVQPAAAQRDGGAVVSADVAPHHQRQRSRVSRSGRLRGAYLLYLNATPGQGGENLRNWAAYRVRVLRSEHASTVREDAAATGLAFFGGTGSCIIDDYVTRIGAHHYEELACLVQGRSGASVIVATAPAARWAQSRPLLEQAVAAYRVR